MDSPGDGLSAPPAPPAPPDEPPVPAAVFEAFVVGAAAADGCIGDGAAGAVSLSMLLL